MFLSETKSGSPQIFRNQYLIKVNLLRSFLFLKTLPPMKVGSMMSMNVIALVFAFHAKS